MLHSILLLLFFAFSVVMLVGAGHYVIRFFNWLDELRNEER